MSIQPYEIARRKISQAGERCKMLLGDLNGDGRLEMLLVQADGDRRSVCSASGMLFDCI